MTLTLKSDSKVRRQKLQKPKNDENKIGIEKWQFYTIEIFN